MAASSSACAAAGPWRSVILVSTALWPHIPPHAAHPSNDEPPASLTWGRRLAHGQAYIRPKAAGNELLLVSRIVVCVFGMFAGVICIILNEVLALRGSVEPVPAGYSHAWAMHCLQSPQQRLHMLSRSRWCRVCAPLITCA